MHSAGFDPHLTALCMDLSQSVDDQTTADDLNTKTLSLTSEAHSVKPYNDPGED